MRSGLIADTRLEAIAGAPAAVRTTTGATTLTPATAFDGRTLYVVYQVVGITVAFPVIAMLGTPPSVGGTAGITLQHFAANNTGSGGRFDTTGGAVGTPGPNGVRTVGKHVAAITINTGITSGIAQVDSSADSTVAVTTGAGMADATLRLQAATANDIPIAAYGYLAAHNRTTRSRILHWLQVRYATTPF